MDLPFKLNGEVYEINCNCLRTFLFFKVFFLKSHLHNVDKLSPTLKLPAECS